MTVKQSDIISNIPTLIRESDFETLITLRSLVASGWGTTSKLYAFLSDLLDFQIEKIKHREVIFFKHDSKTYEVVTRVEKEGEVIYENATGDVVYSHERYVA